MRLPLKILLLTLSFVFLISLSGIGNALTGACPTNTGGGSCGCYSTSACNANTVSSGPFGIGKITLCTSTQGPSCDAGYHCQGSGAFAGLGGSAACVADSVTVTPEPCKPTEDALFTLAAPTDSHVFTTINQPVNVCWPKSTGATPHTCTATNIILKLSSADDAHAAAPTDTTFTTPVCYGDLQCTTSRTDCVTGETCIARLADTSNAHVSKGCSDSNFPVRLCCKGGILPGTAVEGAPCKLQSTSPAERCVTGLACNSNICERLTSPTPSVQGTALAGSSCDMTDLDPTVRCVPGLLCDPQKNVCVGTTAGISCVGTGICAQVGTTTLSCGNSVCGGKDALCLTNAQCVSSQCKNVKCTAPPTGTVPEGGTCVLGSSVVTQACVPALHCDPTTLLCAKPIGTLQKDEPCVPGSSTLTETCIPTLMCDTTTKICVPPTQTCNAQHGNSCMPAQTCSGTTLPSTDTTRCCSVACTTSPSAIQCTPACTGSADCVNGQCVTPTQTGGSGPAPNGNGWSTESCVGRGGITCDGNDACNGDVVEGTDVLYCCLPRDGTLLGCKATDFIPALGKAVTITRGDCIDPDNDGKGTRVVSFGESIQNAKEILTECASVSCDCTLTECKVACTSLPTGGETRTKVPLYTLASGMLTLLLLGAFYGFRARKPC